MNTLFTTIALTIAFFVTALIFTIGVVTKKLHTKGTKIFLSLSAVLTVLALSSVFIIFNYYKSYGVFYGEDKQAYKDKNVESHFVFTTDDTEKLQAVYDSDPENFNTRNYDVLIVKFACNDCEEQAERIFAAKEEIQARKNNPAYIIFSRSEIGQRYIIDYNIENVPVAIIDGEKIQLTTD